jgi:hypothetical protein
MRKLTHIIAIVAALMTAIGVSAQQLEYKTYLDATFKETVRKKATYVREMKHRHDKIYDAKVYEVSGGKLKMEGRYHVTPSEVSEHGIFTYYYENGSIESRGEYEMGVKVGSWKRFAQDGTEKPERYYNPSSAQLIRDATKGN